MTSFPSFDLAAPLPTGLTVLEASAGTGKTWAIAALTVRYLADGLVDAPHLLAVTFTHLASADLRARLYQRLVTTTDMVTQRRAGQSTPPDQLVDVICDGTDQVVNARLARLRQAIGDFDAATVATIHEFCRRAGDWLGGERPPRIDDEDSAALADQTIADLTLARLLSGANDLTADACASLGQAALANPELPIVPGNDQAGEFAKACREEYARRKRTAEVDDFADMAMRLDHVLSDPGTSERVADALAQRFHVVLVDEFQDTDPVQWSILRHAFVGRRPLVLVGDPKQSIYGFRGADVYAYLDAVAHSDATYTLPINYRSDDAVVQAVNQVFTEVDFGLMSAPIPMRISQAAHTSPRLRQGPSGPSLSGLQIRRVATSGAKQRAVIDADLVAWVVDALATHPQLMRDDGRWRAVRADDIAVLVGSNRHGESLNQALRQAGVPAVFSGVASVFASPAADEWLTLLDALAHPRPATLRRAMAGRLIGLPLGDLADAACDQPVTWSARLRGWAGLRLGPAAIIDQLNDLTDMPARLLGLADGERLLTDVRHLSELLAQQARRLTDLSELVVWLRAQRRRAVESGGGDRTRRLETDRPAVAVLTVHAAKGLEFPIVLVPAAADAPRHTWGSPDYPMLWRDSGHRVLDTRSGGPGQATRWHAWAEEQASEERRRLYVALTRASSLVVTWMGDQKAAFSQFVAAWRPEQNRPGVRLVRVTDAPPVQVGERATAGPQVLVANTFTAHIDDTWVRTSYSGLTAGLHDASPGAPTDSTAGGADDEPDAVGLVESSDEPLDDGLLSPMNALPAGAAFGTIVHAVFEACDPASPTLLDDLAAAGAHLRERSTLPDLDVNQLATALVQVLRTPLGPQAQNVSLADMGARRRLAELNFELPLGDAAKTPSKVGRVDALAALFDDPNLVPHDDPLASYGRQLAGTDASQRVLHGFLTGSIDLVTQLPDGRCLLIDYKTNRLGPPDVPNPVAAYNRRAMAAAMMAAHYPLQALLYAVALRRYLAWRRPDVPFDAQWAGAAYLFVRGMAGPHTPLSGGMPCGVYGWRPSPALIEAADQVLRGGA